MMQSEMETQELNLCSFKMNKFILFNNMSSI